MAISVENELNVSWDAVPNAEIYVLNYKPENDTTWETIAVTGNTVVLTDLTTCSPYVFQVATQCGDVLSDFSEITSFTTANCFVEVALTVWLEGANMGTLSVMQTQLQNNNFLPTMQPYSGIPWNYIGTENVLNAANIPNNTVDWVLVELRDANNLTIVISTRAAFLLADGSVVDYNELGATGVVFDDVNAGDYYLAVRHRNHLDVLSSVAVSVPNTTTPYDFTSAPSQAYGMAQQKQMPNGKFALLGGDASADGIISVNDFNHYLNQAATINGYYSADFDLDGVVGVGDFNVYQGNSTVIGISLIRY